MPDPTAPREVPADDALLVFDGRVVEVFNLRDGPYRFHAARMRLDRQRGRKDGIVVRLRDASRSAGQVYLEVSPAQRPAVEDLLAELEIAMAESSAQLFPGD